MNFTELENKLKINIEFLSVEELENMDRNNLFTFDTETNPNCIFALFKNYETGKFFYFEKSEWEDFDINLLKWFASKFIFCGFNNISFDNIVLAAMLDGRSSEDIFKIAASIIENGLTPYNSYKNFKLKPPFMNNFDLINIAPLQGSLKLYGARLNCEVIQELPFEPGLVLTEREANLNRLYCANDINVTELLFKKLIPEIKLRYDMTEQFGIDLRSKSDAQIAEYVFKSELEKLKGCKIDKTTHNIASVRYDVPDYVKFDSPELNSIVDYLATVYFELDKNGSPIMPTYLSKLVINVGASNYKLGMGGLHSQEKCVSYYASEEMELADNDVESYYPRIILNNKLFPEHLGEDFLKVYEKIVNKRLDAKHSGNKIIANSLKIVINGSFGKLGNQYSFIYAPKLMLQVTITGQLSLLMLIEMLEKSSINVVSGNTDGIVSYYPKTRRNDVRNIIAEWEKITDFKTEETIYKSLHCRDVNNYIAVKPEHKSKADYLDEQLGCKIKGTYSEKGSALNSVISKNPENLIVSDSVLQYLRNGLPVEETILNCKDIKRFISVRNVKGGGYKDGTYLGKVVRFYKSKTENSPITYKSGNKVANSDCAKPIMVMPTNMAIPDDLDFNFYIKEAKDALLDLGIIKTFQQKELF